VEKRVLRAGLAVSVLAGPILLA